MTSYVLEASVAAKWFLPPDQEPLTGEALGILEGYAAGRIRLLVPDLFWPEFGNILWKALGHGRISRTSAEEAIAGLEARKIPTAPSAPLLKHAFGIASAFERSVYDGIYVALAVMAGAPLVTADEQLANALAARLPVRWLGSLY